MKKSVMLSVAAAWAAALLVPAAAFAEEPGISTKGADRESVIKAVREQIAKDPQKVLMVVEDFMVSNEDFAADIVKTAILSTKGPADLKKQIAITATHVAPEKAKEIADAVASIAPDEAQTVADATRKEANADTPTVPDSQGATDSSSSQGASTDNSLFGDFPLPNDVRGVFFLSAAAFPSLPAGVLSTSTDESHGSTKTKTITKTVVVNHTSASSPNHPSALSPSSGAP